jgi:argininosuccinate lyase
MTGKKPWAGRFGEPTDTFVEAFTASVGFDRRLYKYDIAGSIAHAEMLAEVGVLADKECESIVHGLRDIEQEIEGGNFAWSTELEDVHMNIEARLTDRIGEVGKKLHTGRSRNDQVATDMRLYLRDAVDAIGQALLSLQQVLIDLAEKQHQVIMPGFTHLQTAQPVSFGHHMLAWFEMLQRDSERFVDCRKRINIMPLGSAALAGTTYPIDRHVTASKLGFDTPAENSLDAVSDRDFAIEFLSASAILAMHLSRFSEELILWSSAQFDFVDLGDAFCTGSSIMPQKKNPDVPELVRGKTGRVYGNLMALLTTMKAQPLAYNKDNQEDKEPLFDTVDTMLDCLRVYTDMMAVIQINANNMQAAANQGYATATDLADYLVGKGIPFRDAHEVVGKAVAFCIEKQISLEQMLLEDLQGFCDKIDQDVYAVLSLQGSVNARNHLGGTAFEKVLSAVARARQRLQQ